MYKLRQSALGDYERCSFLGADLWGTIGNPEVNKSDQVRNKYNETGIIFHEVMEYWGVNAIKGNRCSLEELHELLESKMQESPEEYYDVGEKEKYIESLHEQLEWAWEQCLLDTLTPIGVEVTFDISDVIEGVIPVTGTIDRISGDLKNKQVRLEDYKTGKVYTKKELSSNMQACLYSLAFYKQFGFLPEEFVFYFTKFKKIKVVKITPDFLKEGMARILAVYQKIKDGDTKPDNTNRYFCNHFCESKKRCPLFQKKNNSWDKVG